MTLIWNSQDDRIRLRMLSCTKDGSDPTLPLRRLQFGMCVRFCQGRSRGKLRRWRRRPGFDEAILLGLLPHTYRLFCHSEGDSKVRPSGNSPNGKRIVGLSPWWRQTKSSETSLRKVVDRSGSWETHMAGQNRSLKPRVSVNRFFCFCPPSAECTKLAGVNLPSYSIKFHSEQCCQLTFSLRTFSLHQIRRAAFQILLYVITENFTHEFRRSAVRFSLHRPAVPCDDKADWADLQPRLQILLLPSQRRTVSQRQ